MKLEYERDDDRTVIEYHIVSKQSVMFIVGNDALVPIELSDEFEPFYHGPLIYSHAWFNEGDPTLFKFHLFQNLMDSARRSGATIQYRDYQKHWAEIDVEFP